MHGKGAGFGWTCDSTLAPFKQRQTDHTRSKAKYIWIKYILDFSGFCDNPKSYSPLLILSKIRFTVSVLNCELKIWMNILDYLKTNCQRYQHNVCVLRDFWAHMRLNMTSFEAVKLIRLQQSVRYLLLTFNLNLYILTSIGAVELERNQKSIRMIKLIKFEFKFFWITLLKILTK